jgi:glycosyltransferase involved in cell wall biosynthesis
MTITAVIITKNEEKNIAHCLDSICDIVDEIVILDAFSSDKTAFICQQYPSVKFIQKEWLGYAASKNYANSRATSDFILSIDADEILSDDLKADILNIKPLINADCAYGFNRLNFIGGEPVHHSGWYPDRKVRLFPKKSSYWSGDYAHETLITKFKTVTLHGDLQHFTSDSFKQMYVKQRHYAELGASELFKKHKHIPFILQIVKVFYKFISIYILKLGFLDGFKGFKIACISASCLIHKFKCLKNLENQFNIKDYGVWHQIG